MNDLNNTSNDNIVSKPLPSHAQDNMALLLTRYDEEHAKMSFAQRKIEGISDKCTRPTYLISFMGFVVLWIIANVGIKILGGTPFDEFPFFLLQGIVALNSAVVTITVLIRQSRMMHLSEVQTHLNIQITVLCEQKVTKLIKLVEELRQDSPSVKNRLDPEAEAMQEGVDISAVFDAIEAEVSAQRGDVRKND